MFQKPCTSYVQTLAAISAGQIGQKMKGDIEITSDYSIGEYYSNNGWTRLTLFHKNTNGQGGSLSTPIATIDIIKHPGQDGCNPHSEIRFKIRNDIKRQGGEMFVDNNAKVLRHLPDIVDDLILDKAVEKLKKTDLVKLPLSVYVCMEHVEKFETQGDFWTED